MGAVQAAARDGMGAARAAGARLRELVELLPVCKRVLLVEAPEEGAGVLPLAREEELEVGVCKQRPQKPLQLGLRRGKRRARVGPADARQRARVKGCAHGKWRALARRRACARRARYDSSAPSTQSRVSAYDVAHIGSESPSCDGASR